MMRIVTCLDEQKWRGFVESNPRGNIFQTPEMYHVFERALGHRPALWAAVDEQEQILALLTPVQVTVIDGPLRPLTTRAVAYGSLLPGTGAEALPAAAELLRTYRQAARRTVLFSELRNLSDLSDVQVVLDDKGFAYEDHLNYLVDLTDAPEDVMQRIGRRTRKNIRHALNKGEVVIEEAESREQVGLCYDLLCRTYAQAQVPLADRSLFEATFDVLFARGMVKFLLARVGDAYVASSVELLFKQTIYGWYGGMDREYGSYSVNELLLWYIFEWGSRNGYQVYDFGGAGKPDEEYGVRDFKAKFGGELVCFGRNICVHRPAMLNVSRWGYDLYRRFVK